MKYKYGYFLFSALFLVPGIISLILWGLKPAIDFTGGSILEVQSSKFKGQSEKNQVVELVEKTDGVKVSSIQQTGEQGYILKLNSISNDKKTEVISNLDKSYEDIKEDRFETVGPIIGQELIKKTVIALLLGAGFILLYITQRFHNSKYGICATIATFHDTFMMLGIFSLLGHFRGVEVDTLFVTALLTVLSFSVHDTVVVYDRIRESVKNFPKAHFTDLINKAVAETLSRSVNNSMTIILMLLCLYLLGGVTIKWFSFALLIGTISGTYSSTFTAAPLLVIWSQLEEKRKKLS